MAGSNVRWCTAALAAFAGCALLVGALLPGDGDGGGSGGGSSGGGSGSVGGSVGGTDADLTVPAATAAPKLLARTARAIATHRHPQPHPVGWCLDNLQVGWNGWPAGGCFQNGKVGLRCPLGSAWTSEYKRLCDPLDTDFAEIRSGRALEFLRNKRLVLLGDSQLREASGLLAWALGSPVVLNKGAANMWNLGKVVAPLPQINATAFFKFTMSADHVHQWMEEYDGAPVDVLVLSIGLHDLHLKEGSPEPVADVHQRAKEHLGKAGRGLVNGSYAPFRNAVKVWMDSTLECRSRRTLSFLQSTGRKLKLKYKSGDDGRRRQFSLERKLNHTCERAEGKLSAVSAEARSLPFDGWLLPHPSCTDTCTHDGMHDVPCSANPTKAKSGRFKKHQAPKSDHDVADQCFKPFAFARLQQLLTVVKMAMSQRQS